MLIIDKKIKKQELLFLLNEYGDDDTIEILGISTARLKDLQENYGIISKSPDN